jgi:LemA protein
MRTLEAYRSLLRAPCATPLALYSSARTKNRGNPMTTLWVLLAIVAVVVVLVVVIYNRLVPLRNQYANAFAQIDVQLKRRYDLIPNLVEAVKGYMQHERQTLEAVIAARGAAVGASQRAAAAPGSPGEMRALAQAEGALGGALGKLLAVFESYPQLKADQNVMSLQEELTSTENKIAFARQAYNDFVMIYNTQRESLPDVLVAGPLGFRGADLLQATSSVEEREAPKVKF